MNPTELNELEAFYLREIRAIGDPYTRTRGRRVGNWDVYQQARRADTLPLAKRVITDHISAWQRQLERESSGPDDGPSVRSATAGMLPLSSSDLSNVFGPHTPPRLPEPRGASAKQRQHMRFTYADLQQLGPLARLYKVVELAAEHGTTLYELQKRANTAILQRFGVLDYVDSLADRVRRGLLDADDINSNPRLSLNGLIGVYYRYHKFAADMVSQSFVFGGGFNKSEISSEESHAEEVRRERIGARAPKLHMGAVKDYFKDRHSALDTLSTGTPLEKIRMMERAQANAFSTPFIATTSDRRYTRQLFGEYPPGLGQRAVVLTIIGPAINAFNFEREFAALDRGFECFNMRTTSGRAMDAAQAEYGIPDIFIPVRGRSPLGFVIAKIDWLG